jgi:GNAT superfamily N-acetyltransferase
METVVVHGSYEIDANPARVDRDAIWQFVSTEAYWARWRSRADIEQQLLGSWRVVGCYDHAGRMVGFARAVSDGVDLAYLTDVYVLASHRGRGLGHAILHEMIDNGPGRDFRWMLHTSDAHDLYRKLGFSEPDRRYMERPSRKAAPLDPGQ